MSEPEDAGGELRRELEELQARSARRAAFVVQVAHDLRTPLASVLGAAQTLQQRGDDLAPEQRDALLGVVVTEAERLAALVEEVFDSARIDAHAFSYEFGELDVGSLVEEAVAAAVAGGRPEVVAHVAPGLPAVRGDRARLRQVLANLIENALTYAPGSSVEVGADSVSGDVQITVTDHGDGIAPENQATIFDQFERGPDASRPGTGLGLYISRAIAEAHGGTLDVTSSPGLGATFSLTLRPA